MSSAIGAARAGSRTPAELYGLDGGGAFRGEVPADHAGALERGPDLHVPVVEPVIIAVGL